MSWFLVSLLVLQVGVLGALYVHNMQLATAGAEKALRVQMLEGRSTRGDCVGDRKPDQRTHRARIDSAADLQVSGALHP